MSDFTKVRTCLWFDQAGEDAINFYVGLVAGSEIESVSRQTPDGPAMVIDFSLGGTPYMALNAGPQFKHTPAASICVTTQDQAETDRLWNALTSGGGTEGQCGWLTDRWGLSWQIVPRQLLAYMNSADREAAGRVQKSMLEMKKIDVYALEAAFLMQ
ncbi:MAG: VOC family protein [Pseudomonadota bacterium]